jgi:DNA helicase-2/ATP-dependent DNA helicase PcrA
MVDPYTPPNDQDALGLTTSKAANRIDYAKELNPAQLDAVAHRDGHVLVIAGAGSGKTRTLTYRVAHLVEDGVPPESILLLTFTRRAAQEMLQRASVLLDLRCHKVMGGTFHSFAFGLLRKKAGRINLSNNFIILDKGDSEDLINMIRKQWPQDSSDTKLPLKSTLSTIFSRSINKGVSIEEIIYEDFPHLGYQTDTIYKMWEDYQLRKREHDYLDFDDLLTHLRQLLSEDLDTRHDLQHRLRHILVDEYQDTNHLQTEIISLMTGPHQQLMVVGDDSQSIYAFRGADFHNIITFPEKFPNTRVVKLEQNYRSVQPILDLTNTIINQAALKYEKHLFTRRRGGHTPLLVAAASEHLQSQFVGREIRRRQNQGIHLNEMAVLFRSGYHAFDLEIELARSGIPFVKYGGFKFSESAHVKDLLAHLKILAAPRDRLSWYRVLQLIPKVGYKTAQRIFEAIERLNIGPQGLNSPSLGIKAMPTLEPLQTLIARLDPALTPVASLGEQILDYYLPHLESAYDDHPRRRRDLEQLLSIMQRYDRLDRFLSDMSLEPPNTTADGHLSPDTGGEQHLILSTIHSAKGLEWRTVFIIWALDGRFPSHHAFNRPEDLEEERRLMYVAATRARDELIITYPSQIYDRTSGTLLYEPSRFLEGIDDGILHRRYISYEDG